jgi:hypothetical protein
VALRRADQRDHPADAHSLTHNLEYQSNPEADMGFGRGILLWMIGIPLPLILLLAIFMHR